MGYLKSEDICPYFHLTQKEFEKAIIELPSFYLGIYKNKTRLSYREQRILSERTKKSVKEIAGDFDITRGRLYQIQKNAVSKLKYNKVGKILLGYVPFENLKEEILSIYNDT